MTETVSDGRTLANAAFIDLAVSLYDFVDGGTQTCDFENAEFQTIMDLSKNSSSLISKEIGQITPTSANVSAIGKVVESGDLSLLALRMDTMDVFAAAKLFTGKKLTLCGYPSARYNGSVCGVDFTVGIVSESKVKAGAMKFLETLLSEDVQTSQLIQDSGFPVTEAGVDALLEYDEYYVNITSKGGKTDSITILRYR